MNHLKSILNIVNPVNHFTIDKDNLCIHNESGIHSNIFLNVKSNNKFYAICKNLLSEHVVRVLKSQYLLFVSENNALDVYNFLDSDNILQYCTICGKKIGSYDHIYHCDANNCKKQYMKTITNNIVMDCFNNDKLSFDLLVSTAYFCLLHSKKDIFFNPLPPGFENCNEIIEKLRYKRENYNNLLVKLFNINDDYELAEEIAMVDYAFLKFIITSNITNIRSDLLFDDNKKKLNIDSHKLFDDTTLISYKVDHPPHLTSQFENIKHSYLFHGSSLSNWYSLLRNGVKVCSGTNMQLHGSAYGNGIYLSNVSNVAMGYGNSGGVGCNYVAFGVFQVMQPIENYKKTHSIYVVPNSDELILRYIIVTSNNLKICDKINNYFTQQRVAEITQSSEKCSTIRNNRIAKDMHKISKNDNCKIDMADNTLAIFFTDHESNTHIEICIKYSENYPMEPPHIWISKTNKIISYFGYQLHGGIMSKELSYKTWTANTKIYNIIKNIINSIKTDIQNENGMNNVCNEKTFTELESLNECNVMASQIN
jgi:ubiquitin-protein ligase